MSRSYRKAPVVAFTNAGSMKAWRSAYNRRHRHLNKQKINIFLKESRDWDSYLPSLIREDSSVYDSPKDGSSHYWVKPHENECFDPVTETFDDNFNSRWNEKYWKKIFRK